MISLIFSINQKVAYDMRISYWSSDVASSDLHLRAPPAFNHPMSAFWLKIGLEPACRARIVRRQHGDGVAHLESRQIGDDRVFGGPSLHRHQPLSGAEALGLQIGRAHV